MPFHLNTLSKAPPNEAQESDIYLIPTLATIQLRAWLTVSCYKSIYPGPPSTHPSIIKTSIARHKDSLLNDPTCQIISLLHTSDAEVGEPWKVIAFIKYHVFHSASDLASRTDATDDREWPEGINQSMIQALWSQIAECRRRYGGKLGAHVDVEIVATDPEYQRIGAGKMLMDAVCAEADGLGYPMYLEGTEEGRRLYEKVGFVGQEDVWLDMQRWADGVDKGKDWRGEGAKEGGEGWYSHSIMLRPAKSAANGSI